MAYGSILIRNARVLTLAGGHQARRGSAMSDLGVVSNADVLVYRGTVQGVQPSITSTLRRMHPSVDIWDADGRVVMPAFIDCHTHACFAGSRLEEWDLKRRGVSYQDLLKAGGGIMSTVRATRLASAAQLESLLLERIERASQFGTATIEVKSGYGLSLEHERNMLSCIQNIARRVPVGVTMTALLGHAIDTAIPDFVHKTITETLPAIAAEFPGIAVDAFCEDNAWSKEETVRLFVAAKELGLPLRVHTDQFTSKGMITEAVRLGAVSCDHLEAAAEQELKILGESSTVAVGLPGCGFHLDGRYANLRKVIDAGGAAAIATNFNPGSAPCLSMPMAISLAVRNCGLSPQEAIVAATANPAAVLGLSDRGTIEVGKRGDLVVLNATDERVLAYEFGMNPIHTVFVGGNDLNRPTY